MSLSDTFSTLKTALADELNRSDISDGTLTRWVAYAESEINRRLIKDGPVRQMMGRSDATITTEFIAVPDDFLGARAFYLAPNYLPLEYVDPEEIDRRKTLYPSESGDPQIYSVVGAEFRFWPWNSGGSFSAELTYWKSLAALSNSNTSNWLLAAHPDAYFYTAIIHSAPYLKDDARLTVWAGLSQAIISDIISADKIARTSTHLAVSIVPGGTP